MGVLGAQERRIAAGVGCSPDSDRLVRRAYRRADVTDSTVVAVTSRPVARPDLDPVSADSAIAARTRDVLAASVARALGADRAGAVTPRTTPGSPADALLVDAWKVDPLVVGRRGPRARRFRALGSVIERVLGPATCPVAVTHPAAEGTMRVNPGRIVGVVGSPCSCRALHWAVEQAELTGATVEAALAWEFEPQYGIDLCEPSDQMRTQEVEQLIEHELGALLSVAATLRGWGARGRLARVLIDTSTDADLVVVGIRGAGAALKQTLGSVSRKIARHATVPFVVHDHDRQRVGCGVQHGRVPT